MPEWLKGAVCKTARLTPHVGSNPTLGSKILNMEGYVLVKISDWHPAFAQISLQSKDKDYTEISTVNHHSTIYNIITDITEKCSVKTGEEKMNNNDNSWYAKIEGNELVDIKWAPRDKLREDKIGNVLDNKALSWIKNLFKSKEK